MGGGKLVRPQASQGEESLNLVPRFRAARLEDTRRLPPSNHAVAWNHRPGTNGSTSGLTIQRTSGFRVGPLAGWERTRKTRSSVRSCTSP